MNKIRRKKADAIELDECDKPIIKGLKKIERKIKLYKVFSGIIIISTFLLFIFGIWWVKNLSYAYKFNGESINFSYNDMIFMKKNNVYYLSYGKKQHQKSQHKIGRYNFRYSEM